MNVQLRVADTEVALQPLAADYPAYRRQVIFQCRKWDPQVGDVNTISDHACVLSPETAGRLSRWAEALARETLEVERKLARRPELYAELGIPRLLRVALRRLRPDSGRDIRVMRFDFHPTTNGWALSEVNSDVPGGFAEASALPKLAARYVPGTRPDGDVAGVLVSEVAERVGRGARLALVHATAYSDDRQVMQFLADRFEAAGFRYALLAPDHVRWKDGRAMSIADDQAGPLDAILRFFPAEWLPNLPRRAEWQAYFRETTLMCNSPRAVLTQSKRLPLVWDRLGVSAPTWRVVLPETRDPREAPWRRDERWLLKPALGRVGEGIAWRGSVPNEKWRQLRVNAFLSPRAWVAQRRFEPLSLLCGSDVKHLCVGVFTVNGKASGFYGRLSARPVIDKHAQDVPILIAQELS